MGSRASGSCLRTHAARSADVPVHLEVVSPDVCEHGHFDGQCPEAKGNTDCALAGRAVPEAIRGEADAGARNAGFAEGFGASIDYLFETQRAGTRLRATKYPGGDPISFAVTPAKIFSRCRGDHFVTNGKLLPTIYLKPKRCRERAPTVGTIADYFPKFLILLQTG
jgi:hypothetical protein